MITQTVVDILNWVRGKNPSQFKRPIVASDPERIKRLEDKKKGIEKAITI